MASTEPTSSTTQGVTVIPNNPDPSKWIEDHPIIVAAIVIGGLVIVGGFVIFWICYKKRQTKKKDICNSIEEGESETVPSTPGHERKDKTKDLFGDSFVIIQSPSLSKRRGSKPKRPVAVHPLFSVQRKPSRPNPQRRATIHFAKWSDQGLEIHAAGKISDKQRARAQSTFATVTPPSKSMDARRPSAPAAGPSAASSSSEIPNYYRRVSLGPHHVIFAPDSFKPSREQ